MARKLFTPWTVKDVTIKNRIVMAPMCMYSSHEKDGKLQPFHMAHYISRAIGQVGLIIVEATAVNPQGRISDQDLGIWSDDHIEGFAKLTEQVKAQGSKIGIQLAHAGRKAELEGDIYAPSAIPFDEQSKTPAEMTTEQIKETIQEFKQAAARAKEAGFDIIELHAAHGYLMHEFLSPLSNHRTDEYGGSHENRYRFLGETIEAVKEVWDGPLFVRISASDYTDKGLDIADHIGFAKWMKEQGVDLIDCSSGALVQADINVFPGYQVSFAEKIREQAEIATGAVGLITTGTMAEEILQNNRADLIFVARELLRDPHFARSAAKQLNTEIPSPVQYDRAW
ncbi:MULTISPECIES: NADPH dehydrogenase NamA [Bacillus]|jgi:NADPH2 dehydrogenase|uniref:NADPH dehydrogenase n=5 Tax=Bacillus TaxID=1386 RepID=NAMA_BACVZ|nr:MULTISPECIES: NADPH dehydrogenase NamA [Bacillus]A7Z6E7.1 RecName: Full=NADPH dehydrogenase [Bacillus velezensis FZB42]AIA57694.1 enoate reductase 1 [Bacillus sp. WX16]AIU78013.1 NADPH dehydrogenase [Bacillus subtilis]MBL3612380.1 NADPH dehydrogenase NamA [Bacillus sp. RHFS18]COC69285.1 NADH:flavin oxidoreductase/NADH oxidase family protein [Streptococcus pneumoniae]SLB18317.1 NADH/flavin oxidoreductase [Mycobacteroides abscessus subsp. massiliense]